MKKIFAMQIPITATANVVIEESNEASAFEIAESMIISLLRSADKESSDLSLTEFSCDYDKRVVIESGAVVIPEVCPEVTPEQHSYRLIDDGSLDTVFMNEENHEIRYEFPDYGFDSHDEFIDWCLDDVQRRH